jgi:hypothetical protein
MPMHRCAPKSFLFKILPVNPCYSEILVLTSLQVHCFHRPEGEGVPPGARVPAVGEIRVNADCRHHMNRESAQ